MNVELNISNDAPRFDWIVRDGPSPNAEPWNIPLVQTASFVALPSLGAIVPGWVLIVPRIRSVNLAALTPAQRQDLAELRSTIVETLSAHFDGEIFEFEHGPATAGGLLGCGVDQAHLHVAPLHFDLLDAIAGVSQVASVETADEHDPWAAVRAGADYWMARHVRTNTSLIAYPDTPISQGIRKIVAAHAGDQAAWNYRTHPHLEHVYETIRAFPSVER